MDRSLLCGYDGSQGARKAAAFSESLAEPLAARLVLAHVAEEPAPFPYGDRALRERAMRQSLSHSERLLREIGSAAERRILRGPPVRALADAADELRAVLIAVGSRGHGPLKAALLGSTSRSLARESRCPVLVVPDEAELHGGSTVVCGVDGSDATRGALRAAVELAALLDLELVLTHVQVPEAASSLPGAGIVPPVDYAARLQRSREAAEDLVRDAVEPLGRVPFRERVVSGDVTLELERAAAVEDARLIVVGARGLGAVEGAALGSVSHRLAGSAPRPVLVVREDLGSLDARPGSGDVAA